MGYFKAMGTVTRKINSKADQLMSMARATYEKDREAAKELVVLAIRTEDAMSALDRLLPKIPEPQMDLDEVEDLSPGQVGRIMALVRELEQMHKKKIASTLLAKVERIEQMKKKNRRKKV
jgi:uncharacterized membrane protein